MTCKWWAPKRGNRERDIEGCSSAQDLDVSEQELTWMETSG